MRLWDKELITAWPELLRITENSSLMFSVDWRLICAVLAHAF
jgi:hypothetical protein